MLNVYSFFHLNTSFSSIEIKKIPELIKKCYWPLLKLIEENNDFKLAVEASGKTINDINRIDPEWVRKLSKLIFLKKCEFIGSGYCQIISPGVPPEVSEINLKLGFEIYSKLLNTKPKIGLIGEQVFSKSMVKIYKKYFKAIFLDWIQVKNNLKESTKKDQLPSYVKDDYGNKILVIWTNSLSFQKFQRLIYNEIDLENYLSYIKSEKFSKFLCLYSNDCEIFNFRPKRFSSEISYKDDEWKKIRSLYKILRKNEKIKFCFPSFAIKFNDKKNLVINNEASPIIVKKQPKYNISRWLVCGRNNFILNRDCWKLYSILDKRNLSINKWKRLCEYWSSDLRTHCTDKKFKHTFKRLKKDIRSLVKNKVSEQNTDFKKKINFLQENNIFENDNFLIFENKKTKIVLNKKKGLTIDSFVAKEISEKSLFGTLYQGSLKNLENQSGVFSGHFNLFNKDLDKITDLSISRNYYKVFKNRNGNFCIEFSHKFKSSEIIKKKIEVDLNKSQLNFKIEFKNVTPKILRVFILTINPQVFNKKNLIYCCKNGGRELEKFLIKKSFNHGKHIQDVSKFTSSNNCLPMTDGKLIFGDKEKELIFSINNFNTPVVGLIEYEKLAKKYLLRTSFSLRESDDTFKMTKFSNLLFQVKVDAKKK